MECLNVGENYLTVVMMSPEGALDLKGELRGFVDFPAEHRQSLTSMMTDDWLQFSVIEGVGLKCFPGGDIRRCTPIQRNLDIMHVLC